MVFTSGLSLSGSDGSLGAALTQEGKQLLFPVGTCAEQDG